jgi:hypothetical protein
VPSAPSSFGQNLREVLVPKAAVIRVIHGVSLHKKPALAATSVVPPLKLLAPVVAAQIHILSPFPEVIVLRGALQHFTSEGKLANGALSAVRATQLETHALFLCQVTVTGRLSGGFLHRVQRCDHLRSMMWSSMPAISAVFRIIHTTPGGSSSRGDFRIPDLDVENVNFRIVVDFQGSSVQDFSTFEVRYRCSTAGSAFSFTAV